MLRAQALAHVWVTAQQPQPTAQQLREVALSLRLHHLSCWTLMEVVPRLEWLRADAELHRYQRSVVWARCVRSLPLDGTEAPQSK